MENFENANNQLSQAEAMGALEAILGRMKQTGAVDEEPDMIEAIRVQLNDGRLTPTEAVARAEAIESARQNYH